MGQDQLLSEFRMLMDGLRGSGISNYRIEKDTGVGNGLLNKCLKGERRVTERVVEKLRGYAAGQRVSEPDRFVYPLETGDCDGGEVPGVGEAPWVAKVRAFCEIEGITPEDLIQGYERPRVRVGSYPGLPGR